MPNRATLVSKIMLPGLLFGYAALANGTMLAGISNLDAAEPRSVGALFDGSVTSRIDTLYKTRLPHRDPSIGLVGAIRYLAFDEGRKGVVVGKEGWLFSDEEFATPHDETRAAAAAAEEIASVRDKLSALGSNLLLVPLPAKADIYRERLGDEAVADALAARYAAFRSELAARSVDAVDTRAALLEASGREQVFLRTDTHWTPNGAAIVAETIGEAEAGFGGEIFKLQPNGSASVQGDLTKFITNARYAGFVGLQPETVALRQAVAETPEAEALGDIFGTETTIPAVLVGTSYSANENWSFAEELKAALGADVLNVAEQGRGPVHPMRKYLDSETLRRSPPKLVIWEFPVRYLARRDLWSEGADKGSAVGQSASAQPATPGMDDRL